MFISNTVEKKQHNFWNHFLFHPTDAVEDPWGKRILDRISEDGSILTVRIYTMFEDIVYLDENEQLAYDFRVNDLRLDYLVEKGYKLLLAYGFMPECIATNSEAKVAVNKNKTRYKGKMINTSIPVDYALWEEICFQYTRHIIERYGIEEVSTWYLQCFNEPDIFFFMSDIPADAWETRLQEYCKLYAAFERGLKRVSEKVRIGGPSLAGNLDFLAGFLAWVKEQKLRLDFVSVHNYGTSPTEMANKTRPLSVNNSIEKHKKYLEVLSAQGFPDTEFFVDEWGAAAWGFCNVEEYPDMMFRETEVFSSYYVKLISELIEQNLAVSKMMICLSGQHEMTEDFSGFRNFFTLNFIAKPIYNAYCLASKLKDNMLAHQCENKNIFVVPTKSDKGEYAILLTYASENFEEDIPDITETMEFEETLAGRKVEVYCIDKNTTNPYRFFQRSGEEKVTDTLLPLLKEEGRLKPIASYTAADGDKIRLNLTPNAIFLITVS